MKRKIGDEDDREERAITRKGLLEPINEKDLEIVFWAPSDAKDEEAAASNEWPLTMTEPFGAFVEALLRNLARRVEIHPKTGKGVLVEQVANPAQSLLATMPNDFLLGKLVTVQPHVSPSQARHLFNEMVNMSDLLTISRDFYTNLVREHKNTSRVHVVDQSYLGSLDDLVHSAERNTTLVTLATVVDHATSRPGTPFHHEQFWLLIYDAHRKIMDMLSALQKAADQEVFNQAKARKRIAKFNDDDAENDRLLWLPFHNYLLERLDGRQMTREEARKFVDNLQDHFEVIPRSMSNYAYTVMARMRYFKIPARDQDRSDAIPLDEKQRLELRKAIAYFLAPGIQQASDLGFGVGMASLESKVTQGAQYALDLFDFVTGVKKNDSRFEDITDAEAVDSLLFYPTADEYCLFDDENNDKTNGVLLWLLFADRHWTKTDRLTLISSRKDAVVFNHIETEDKAPFDVRLDLGTELLVPAGMRKFWVNWDKVTATLDEQVEFAEWLFKKQPRYRRIQAETFLFKTPLGMIQQWTQTVSSKGETYSIKERKDTYKADPEQKKKDRQPEQVQVTLSSGKRPGLTRDRQIPKYPMSVVSSFMKGRYMKMLDP
jgi:hypothetical protein